MKFSVLKCNKEEHRWKHEKYCFPRRHHLTAVEPLLGKVLCETETVRKQSSLDSAEQLIQHHTVSPCQPHPAG
jgi:hypothetical protein